MKLTLLSSLECSAQYKYNISFRICLSVFIFCNNYLQFTPILRGILVKEQNVEM